MRGKLRASDGIGSPIVMSILNIGGDIPAIVMPFSFMRTMMIAVGTMLVIYGRKRR